MAFLGFGLGTILSGDSVPWSNVFENKVLDNPEMISFKSISLMLKYAKIFSARPNKIRASI